MRNLPIILFLFPLFWAHPACRQPESAMEEAPERQPCTCIFFRPGHQYLLSDVEVVDEETNSSRQAMEDWKELEADLDLSFDGMNQKSLELRGKLLIPYLDPKGVRYFRVIRMAQNGEKKDYEKFVAEYCIQYELDKDPETCDIRPERLDSFRDRTERLAAMYLRAKKQENAPKPSSTQTSQVLKKIRIIYPEEARSPELEVQPRPARTNCGLLSCEVWVRPGDYIVQLHKGGNSWSARFSHETGLLAGNQFTQN